MKKKELWFSEHPVLAAFIVTAALFFMKASLLDAGGVAAAFYVGEEFLKAVQIALVFQVLQYFNSRAKKNKS